MSNTDSEVPQVPQDTISSLTFGSLSNTGFLTAGCWNKSVSLWTVSPPPGSTATSALSITAAASTSHEAPVLSTTFDANSGLIVSGGCDNQVRAWNFTANQSTVIGQHQSAVKDVRAVPSLNAIVSGSWDRTICYWDVRSQTKQPVAKIDLPGKVFSMDASGNIVAVGLEQKLFCVIDVRNPTAFAESTTSPHEFQTRVVAAMPNDAGYAIGSTEGRVHLQYFNDLAFHSFPFRCHRVTEGTRTIVHPVTSLSFHPGTGALATTGGPSISLWDHYGKVSISTFEPKNAGTISTGIFSGDGNYYGYACSYDWSMGANGPGRQKPHKIFIRRVTPQMVSVSARPVQK